MDCHLVLNHFPAGPSTFSSKGVGWARWGWSLLQALTFWFHGWAKTCLPPSLPHPAWMVPLRGCWTPWGSSPLDYPAIQPTEHTNCWEREKGPEMQSWLLYLGSGRSHNLFSPSWSFLLNDGSRNLATVVSEEISPTPSSPNISWGKLIFFVYFFHQLPLTLKTLCWLLIFIHSKYNSHCLSEHYLIQLKLSCPVLFPSVLFSYSLSAPALWSYQIFSETHTSLTPILSWLWCCLLIHKPGPWKGLAKCGNGTVESPSKC